MRGSNLALCLPALLFSLSTYGRVLNSLEELGSNEVYDFIIIGSGPGGSTVASRLSDNPSFRVLLIEAGPNDEGIKDMVIPAHHDRASKVYTWDYPTLPQPGLNGRSFNYTQGRSLGGGSSINGMGYTRGPKDDFDNWAKVTGDKGWKWENLVPYMKKNERFMPPPGGRNISGEYNPVHHGYKGNVGVSLQYSTPSAFEERCLEKAAEKKEFSYNLDMNSGEPLGLGWIQWAIGNGERSSASKSMLTPAVRARPNLTILANTYALRALPTTSHGGIVNIRTVELGKQAGSPTKKVTARKEVIVSAGVFGTPRFLLNSGIGDQKELRQAGVRPIHHLPDVGRGLADHLSTTVLWTELVPPAPIIDYEAALAEWEASRTGPLTVPTSSIHQILWARIPSNATLWQKYPKDPSTGPTAPHIEIVPLGGGGVVGAVVVLLSPRSRGSVKISSNDPFQPPVIDLGLLTHPFDIQAFKEGVRMAKRFFSGSVWDGYVGEPLSADPDTDPAAWDEQLRSGAATYSHPVGTAAMSRKNSHSGVLDPELRVKGVKGLRVVDSSAFPLIPAAHTQVPVYVLAERASDLIKREWSTRR